MVHAKHPHPYISTLCSEKKHFLIMRRFTQQLQQTQMRNLPAGRYFQMLINE